LSHRKSPHYLLWKTIALVHDLFETVKLKIQGFLEMPFRFVQVSFRYDFVVDWYPIRIMTETANLWANS